MIEGRNSLTVASAFQDDINRCRTNGRDDFHGFKPVRAEDIAIGT